MTSKFSDNDPRIGMRHEKKAYASPKLVEYGTLANITLSVNPASGPDNAGMGNNMTKLA